MQTCRGCGSRALEGVITARSLPVQEGRLYDTPAAARAAETADIELVYCLECGLVFNAVFDPSLLGFDPSYSITLHHSPTYRAYTRSLIDRLCSRYALAGGTILEIGSGKGELLRELCAASGATGLGFDPTYDGPDQLTTPPVRFYRRFFEPVDARAVGATLVVMKSVLQYLTDPSRFLGDLRGVVGEGCGLSVEVPAADDIFASGSVWNVGYEHPAFYSRGSLSRLLERSGFNVRACDTCLEGQNLYADAAAGRQRKLGPTPDDARLTPLIRQFAKTRSEHVQFWKERLARWRQAGRRVALWGGGARAISFLCTLSQDAQDIRHVCDINPARQGRYLPVTAQALVSPAQLRQISPDVVVATAPTYAREIRENLREIGLDCEFTTLADVALCSGVQSAKVSDNESASGDTHGRKQGADATAVPPA